jgi:hypothetical protein
VVVVLVVFIRVVLVAGIAILLTLQPVLGMVEVAEIIVVAVQVVAVM